jgi:hypothetical protein
MMLGIQYIPSGTTCALCGREVPKEVRERVLSAQYLTCNFDPQSTTKHSREELRAYFAEHGVDHGGRVR